MIDKALIGAIERSLERNEPIEFLKQSLLNSGYSHQDIEEAFKLIDYRKKHATEILPQTIQEKPLQKEGKKTRKQLSFGKSTVLISALSLSMVIFIIFYLYIRPIYASCRTFSTPTLRKEVLGLAVNCNQVAIIHAETLVALATILALIAIVIYLSVRKRQL